MASWIEQNPSVVCGIGDSGWVDTSVIIEVWPNRPALDLLGRCQRIPVPS
jgi:hypothetical protein